MSYKRHTKEFKQKVLREVEQGKSPSVVARSFAVSRQLIYEWQQRQRDGTLQDPAQQRAAQLDRQVADLERKVGQLTMENEFLKKTLECLETRFPREVAEPEPKSFGKPLKSSQPKTGSR